MPDPSVKHIVLLKFRLEATNLTIKELFRELDDLVEKIDGLTDFTGGPNNSREGLHKDYTHGFVMTFRDRQARDAYLPHPDHEAVKQKILPWVDEVLAFDFET